MQNETIERGLKEKIPEIQEVIQAVGGECSYIEIDDPNGHDGFLLATKEIGTVFSSLI